MTAIHRSSRTAAFSSVWNINSQAAEIEIPKWHFQNQNFWRAREQSTWPQWKQFAGLWQTRMASWSETPNSQNTERNYDTLLLKAHKDQWSILSPELLVLKRIQKKILCTTLSPKLLTIPLRHFVPHTAVVTNWGCWKLKKKTKYLVLVWPWYIHQAGDGWFSCTRSTNRRNAWIKTLLTRCKRQG